MWTTGEVNLCALSCIQYSTWALLSMFPGSYLLRPSPGYGYQKSERHLIRGKLRLPDWVYGCSSAERWVPTIIITLLWTYILASTQLYSAISALPALPQPALPWFDHLQPRITLTEAHVSAVCPDPHYRWSHLNPLTSILTPRVVA